MSPLHRIPFHFHAEGHALSAEFRHPLWSVIPAQASASLPTIGGHASAHVEHFHHQDFVHFERAHTHISGKRRRDESFVTHASVTVHNLNILNRITADLIVSRLTSIHKPDDPEGHITADDTRFVGLKIDGKDVNVVLRHDLLVKCRTHDDLRKAIASDEKSGKIVALPKNRQVAICSLVEKLETKLPGADPKKHLIEIKGFGKIFLAEIFAEPGTISLTMLRLELGSPHVADMTGAETRINGQPPPGP